MDKVWQIAKSNNRKILKTNVSSVSALIKLTSSCRSRCKYCLSWKTTQEYLPLDTVTKVIKDLGNFAAHRITFSGGEPTIHPDFAKIINEAKKVNTYVTVISDGQFLNSKEWLHYVDELTISIDTINPKDYKMIRGIDGLKVALGNLETAIKQGIRVSVNIVMSKQAIHGLMESVKHFARLGVSNIYFLELETHLKISTYIIPTIKDIKILSEEYVPLLKSRYPMIVHIDDRIVSVPNDAKKSIACLIPMMHLTIRPNGEVYPCCRIGDDDPDGNDKSYCLGNVKNLSISDIWLSLNRFNILNSIMNSPPYPCQNCSIGPSFTNPEIWNIIESIRM